jgi:hypothetical protein
MKPRLAVLLLATLCWAASTSGPSAYAQSPYPAGCWWPYSGPYAGGSWEELPYFAVFPPVYYRGVTPRTYGYSPFAWVGEAAAPQRFVASETSGGAPLVVINQYVAGNVARQVPVSAAAPPPLLIKNPYVKP